MPAYDADGCNRECTDFSKSLAQASLMAAQGIPMPNIFLFLHQSAVRQAENKDSHTVFASQTDPWPGVLIDKLEAGDGISLTAQAPELVVGRGAREDIVRIDVDEPLPAGGVAGDVIYHDGTSWVLLAKEDNGDLLTLDTGLPAWSTKLLPPQTPASGDIIYYNGTAWISLAKGTTLQHLRMNAAATAPEWTAPPVIPDAIPTGAVIWRAVESTPTGYLPCDGEEYDLTTEQPGLYAVIGTAFNTGGETANHFRVPDCRGRVMVCRDAADAVLGVADAIGETGGAETIDVGHDHTLDAADHFALGGVSTHDYNITATGWDTGTASKSIVQPFITMFAYIKT